MDIQWIKKEIGKKLRRARKERGYSQEEMATVLGLTRVGYGSFERGINLISLEYLLHLPRILGKPITYFLPDSAVSDAERKDILLDPRVRDILALWPCLETDDQKLVHEIMLKLGEKSKRDKMNKL